MGLLDHLSQRLSRIAPSTGPLQTLVLAMPELDALPLPAVLQGGWSWNRPSEGLHMLGWGEALSLYADSLADLSLRIKEKLLPTDKSGARLFLGHSFDGNDVRAVLPAVLLRRQEDRTELILSHAGRDDPQPFWLRQFSELLEAIHKPQAEEEGPISVSRHQEMPTREEYLRRVAAAVRDIRRGTLSKVVLSRQVTLRRSQPFDARRLGDALVQRYPTCAVFGVPFGQRMLLAASPERLISRRGDFIESHALAGTAPTELAAHALMNNLKERQEHAIVVDWIAAALKGHCLALDVPSGPRLLPVGALQHLQTPIRGRLAPGSSLLEMIPRLHPTPAVAGAPLAEARRLLTRLGEARRHWYSGVYGWLDTNGDGDMAVVLRCALLDGHQAELSAGAGIVAASEPEAEFAETELKLRAMLETLQAA